jgi:hypothetical protein
MSPFSLSRWIPVLGCVWLNSAPWQPAQAQLAINVDDSGVSLQNGDQAPLVVGPGQSFGGTLTPHGFQGVLSDSSGGVRKVQPGMMNPFRDARPTRPAAPQGLQINAGGISVSLPGAAPAPRMTKPEPLSPAQFAALRHLARTTEPSAVLAEVDRMLLRSPGHSDLLQLKALLLMQESRPREAAACVYDALALGPHWTWPVLRSCFATQEGVEVLYRSLKKELREKPTSDRMFLLAWWERMLQHDREATNALQQAMEAHPQDRLMARLHEEWSATVDAEAPPPAQP